MTLTEFINTNMWGLIVGFGSLAATVLVIRVTLSQVVRDIDSLTTRLGNHEVRLSDLEKHQAERLGYERALRELENAA